MVTLLDDERLFLVTPYGNSETLLGDGKMGIAVKYPKCVMIRLGKEQFDSRTIVRCDLVLTHESKRVWDTK